MHVLMIRGASGAVVWAAIPTGRHTGDWVCSRDNFRVESPVELADAESAVIAIVQHSASLVGAISQIVEVNL